MSPANLAEALNWIDWYVMCLRRVNAGLSVAGLGEAEAGYEAARNWLLQW